MFWVILGLACEPAKDTTDLDGDGVISSIDCDDNNANIYPNQTELCDGIDNDCDGSIDNNPTDGTFYYVDNDTDGYGSIAFYVSSCEPVDGYVENSEDCDDSNGDINPDEDDICDGLDNDCDGEVDEGADGTFFVDEDGDGAGDPAQPLEGCDIPDNAVDNDLDCDDTNPEVFSTNTEQCDGIDNDCDGDIDEDVIVTFYYDQDGDGFGDSTIFVEACVAPSGYVERSGDCDDLDPLISPDSQEVCDYVDNDCDGDTDESDSIDAVTYFTDADGDGFGDEQTSLSSCTQPSNTTTVGGDCNDSTDDLDGDGVADGYNINPSAYEVCDTNDVDENCNGLSDDNDIGVDPNSLIVFYTDNDGDGEGDPNDILQQCEQPVGFVGTGGDCNDADSSINSFASEICDGIDNNCDTQIDEGFSLVDYFLDQDGDGFGDPATVVSACQQPSGTVTNQYDCDDTDSNVNPVEVESCDGVDNNCDSQIDEGFPIVNFYTDADGDGFGDPLGVVSACQQPSGTVANQDDCDDANPAINPNATEVCDDFDVDENCNTFVDDNDVTVDTQSQIEAFLDGDGDGYGEQGGLAILSCDLPSGYAVTDDDCNDSDDEINPAAIEVCDDLNIDEDCNGYADDLDSGLSTANKILWAPDVDLDGFGDQNANFIFSCEDPSTSVLYVDNFTDCDDQDANVNPSAAEVCDPFDVDEDCNGFADDLDPDIDPQQLTQWFEDADGDGYGDDNGSAPFQCEQPLGFIDQDGDCDDQEISINPSATEVCDSFDTDENCNGLVDNDDPGVDGQTQTQWYLDNDQDGFGDPAGGGDYCDDPTTNNQAFVLNFTDCDDTNASANPNGSEWYGNAVDEDCDGYDYYRNVSCVGYTVPGDYSTLQSAVNDLQNTNSVETICLDSGTYNGGFNVGGNLEIIGVAREEVFVTGRLTLRSTVDGSETTLAHLSVTDGVDVTDNGPASERTFILRDGSFTSTSQYWGVYVERNSGKDIDLIIERSELEGHKNPQRAGIAIYDDGLNPNGFLNISIYDSWLRDSASAIYLSHEGNYYNYPQLYMEVVNNSFTGNDYGTYIRTVYSSSEFVMYNNLSYANGSGWYWYDFSSVGGVDWDYSVFWAYNYLQGGSYFHSSNISIVNPSLEPGFVEPIPTETSALIGYGESGFVSTLDYFRNPRYNTPIIGAFEAFPSLP